MRIPKRNKAAVKPRLSCKIEYLPGTDCLEKSVASELFTDDSEHLEIFAVFPVRDFGLEALDLGLLDVDVVVDELGAERGAKERVGIKRDNRLAQGLRQQIGLGLIGRIG